MTFIRVLVRIGTQEKLQLTDTRYVIGRVQNRVPRRKAEDFLQYENSFKQGLESRLKSRFKYKYKEKRNDSHF